MSAALTRARAPAHESFEPVVLRLPGPPRGKGRHRSRIARGKDGGQFIRNYADPEAEAYEARLQRLAAEAMEGRPLLDGPLVVAIWAYRTPPASMSKRALALAFAGQLRPTTKPDLDNYAKHVDGLNKYLWTDDALVVRLFVEKLYAEKPALVIRVERWTPPAAPALVAPLQLAAPLFAGAGL